jgi:hypothetical protein
MATLNLVRHNRQVLRLRVRRRFDRVGQRCLVGFETERQKIKSEQKSSFMAGNVINLLLA